MGCLALLPPEAIARTWPAMRDKCQASESLDQSCEKETFLLFISCPVSCALLYQPEYTTEGF